MRGHLYLLPFVAMAAGPPARSAPGVVTVRVGLKTYTEAQIVAGQVQISEGRFMVGVKDKDKVEALLESAKQQLGWEPATRMRMLAMFVGELNQDQILWFMRNDDVKYIEADGKVHVAEREGL